MSRFGYIGFYERKQYEVYAEAAWPAKQALAKMAHKDWPRRGIKRISAEMHVVLAEKDGQPVVHHAVD